MINVSNSKAFFTNGCFSAIRCSSQLCKLFRERLDNYFSWNIYLDYKRRVINLPRSERRSVGQLMTRVTRVDRELNWHGLTILLNWKVLKILYVRCQVNPLKSHETESSRLETAIIRVTQVAINPSNPITSNERNPSPSLHNSSECATRGQHLFWAETKTCA